jgi:hypothetical protein
MEIQALIRVLIHGALRTEEDTSMNNSKSVNLKLI